MTQQCISIGCLLDGDRNYTRPHALCNHSTIIHFSFGWETWRWTI